VVDEWDRDGKEDIRSMGRWGRGILSNESSERFETGDKGDWSDIGIGWSYIKCRINGARNEAMRESISISLIEPIDGMQMSRGNS
jgi:hypothetical protein